MNIKKKSIIIPAFALLIGASLAGSISGTVAWYQYSTRVNAAYVGISGGESGNLQIKLPNGDWVSRLTFDDIGDYLADNSIGQKLAPVTPGAAMDKDSAIPTEGFLRNPIAGHGPYSQWEGADDTNYVSIPLKLRYVEREDGNENEIEKNIYLSDLLIQKDPSAANAAKDDISEAVRVHISCDGEEHLISLNGGSIDTHGHLDLDGDGADDQAYNGTDKYGFDGGSLVDIEYGEGEQEAYAVTDLLVGTNNSDLKLTGVSDDKVIGKTKAGGVDMIITIWVEGWQELDADNYPSLWDSTFIDSSFDVGFEFAVNPEE